MSTYQTVGDRSLHHGTQHRMQYLELGLVKYTAASFTSEGLVKPSELVQNLRGLCILDKKDAVSEVRMN